MPYPHLLEKSLVLERSAEPGVEGIYFLRYMADYDLLLSVDFLSHSCYLGRLSKLARSMLLFSSTRVTQNDYEMCNLVWVHFAVDFLQR